MKKRGPTIVPLAPAHLVWLGAVQTAALLACFDIRWSLFPLVLFLLLCAAAPFCYRHGFFLPLVSRGPRRRRAVSLTFDDGPDPAVTPRLLDLLERHGITAAFFVTGVRAGEHPPIIDDILARGHAVGNHSHHHDPLLMLRSSAALSREVLMAQERLARHGVTPLAFRPPVGITNPRLWRALIDAGMFCCTFSRRAGDRGNRRVRGIARRILRRVAPGDIVLLHDVTPRRDTVEQWLAEVEELIAGLRARELEILPLEDLIGRPVMERHRPLNQVQVFYDAIADDYDREMTAPGATAHRLAETVVAREWYPQLKSGDRVLEIGAGTGRFTLELARRCRSVTALDLSPRMLALLERRGREAGLANIAVHCASAEEDLPPGPFDRICSFSAVEYIADLPGLLNELASRLSPGGTLYLLTAHASLPRFFVQAGNALRQGIWLHARSRRALRRDLAAAGFTVGALGVHGLRLGPLGGLLVTVTATRRIPGR